VNPLLLVLSLALAAPAASAGVPASAAALFHQMDEATIAGDVEGVVALFDEDYRSPSWVGTRERIESVTRRLHQSADDVRLETTILDGRSLGGGIVAFAVDHELSVGDAVFTIPKTYLLRKDEAGRHRIVFSVDQDREGPRAPGAFHVEVSLLQLSVSAPEDWIALPMQRSFRLSQDLLLHPSLDRWIEVAVLDPGPWGLDDRFSLERRLMGRRGREVEVLEEEAFRLGGLKGRRQVLSVSGMGDLAGRRREVALLRRDGLALRLEWETPAAAGEPGLAGLVGLALRPVHGSLLHRALEEFGRGQVSGRRYRNDEAGLSFSLPRGWTLQLQASSFAYMVHGRGPAGEVFQAWAIQAPPGKGKEGWKPRGEETVVAGLPGRRSPSFWTDDGLSVSVQAPDGLLHFFELDRAEEAGPLLERILSTLEWKD